MPSHAASPPRYCTTLALPEPAGSDAESAMRSASSSRVIQASMRTPTA